MKSNLLDSETQQEQSNQVTEIIIFRVEDQEYAIPIMSVQEIIEYQLPTRIPNSPSFVEGIINLRGRIIPILDSRKRLGITASRYEVDESDEVEVEEAIESDASPASKASEERIIILQIKEETVGLIVDAVSEVLNLTHDAIDQPPQDLTIKACFVTGIGKYQSRLLILLDPAKIISLQELEKMSAEEK